MDTYPSISFLIGRAFSIFGGKMEEPCSSEMYIKVLIPVPTFDLQAK